MASLLWAEHKFNSIKQGREDEKDDSCPGHPSRSAARENIEAGKERVFNNLWITIREAANDECQAIFMDVLGIKHDAKFSKFRMDIIVPKMLTTFNDNLNLLERGIAADKSWVYGYDNETKVQSSA